MNACDGIKIEGNKVLIKDELTKTEYRIDFDYLVDIVRSKMAKNLLLPIVSNQNTCDYEKEVNNENLFKMAQ